MNFSELLIKRPVLASVLNLIIILTGLVAFFKLPVRATPDVNPPIITIQTMYPGASPLYVERNITSPIEYRVKSVQNIDYIQSESTSGMSQITITFLISANIDDALSDIRSKIAEAMPMLPQNINPPIASKMNSNDWATIWISATGEKYDTMVLTDIITQRILPELEKLPNVSMCKVYTNAQFAIQIELDPVKLFQYKISPIDVKNQVTTQGMDYPAGNIKTELRNYTLILNGTLETVEEYKNLIIKADSGKILKLSDIANVELKSKDYDNIIRYNGTETVTIGVVRDSQSNIVDLSEEVRKKLPELQKELPEGIVLHIAFDNAVPVKASIASVYETAFEALVLVLLIVYLFLGDLRSTIIPFVAIPVSLIGAFAFMQFFGFSINLYSLLAMIMAIGLVVDDAIVMLENIHKNIENGMSPIEASLKSTKEIGFVIVAMTLTLSAVFLPIGFIEGFVGKLFIEFAWTLAFCVIISGFVALTLSPMLCSNLLIKEDKSHRPKFITKFNEWFNSLSSNYVMALKWALKNPLHVSIVAIGLIITLFVSFYLVKKEFMPQEDDGYFMISGSSPDGASLKYTVNGIKQVEEVLKTIPEVQGYFFNAYLSNAFGFIPLKNWSDRSRSANDIINFLRPIISQIPSVTFYAMNPMSMGGSFESAVSFNLMTFDDFDNLKKLSQDFKEEMKKSNIFSNVDTDLKASIPTLEIQVNRDIAALHNIYLDDVGLTMQFLFGSQQIATFDVGNEKYDVNLGFAKNNTSKVSDLAKVYIKSKDGKMYHLSNVASINETVSIQSYNHYNTAKSIQLSAELSEKSSISEAKAEIERIASKFVDKTKVGIEYMGEIKRMDQSNNDMLFTFLLALVFIYLVLAAQFESFLDPLIIILAVPFSITGGVIALGIGGSSLNMYSNIGIITLVGLITKNSIMIVEFTNQLRKDGMNKFDALIEACHMRLRPIAMTTLATILGCMPLVLAHGASAASRSSIGLVIVGGMFLGTIFTLFIIPTIYYRVKK